MAPSYTNYIDGQWVPAASGRTFENRNPADTRDLEGRPVAMGDFAGKVVLLDFWATGCGPCKQDMPQLVETWRKWHERGFEILGVCLDGANEGAKVRDLVQTKGLPWRNVYWATGRNPIGEAYDVRALPWTLLIGRDGRVAAVGARGKDLEKEIEKAMKLASVARIAAQDLKKAGADTEPEEKVDPQPQLM